MTFPITGASADDRGPAGCVVRFIRAGAARDNEAAGAELHPDCRARIGGDVKSPDVTAVALGEPEAVGDRMQVPARLTGPDGSEQRFVFVVREADGRWGIDLDESVKVTFGGDPLEMMGDALRDAVAPLGEAMGQLGAAMGQAFGGSDGQGGQVAARRVPAHEPLPSGATALPAAVGAQVTELELRRRVQRSFGEEELSASTELTVRCHFELDPAWSVNACLGITLERAKAIKGEDLLPADAASDLGAEKYSSWERERREVYARFALAAPCKAFTGLAELAGTIRLDLVGGEPLEVAIGPVGGLLDQPTVIPAFGIEILFARDGDGNLVMRTPYNWTNGMSGVLPVDAQGQPLNDSWSSSGDGEFDTRTYQSGIPDDASIVFRFWSQAGTAEIPFTTGGLPLKLG
jgi:hypothetical protein